MAGSLIAWEVGFKGVRFLITLGLTPPAPSASKHDVFRGVTPAATPNVFGQAPAGGGKVFR